MNKLKGGLPYNTDSFSYWQSTIQASYAVMRQLLFLIVVIIPGHNLGNSQVGVYRTIGPTLVFLGKPGPVARSVACPLHKQLSCV